MTDIEKYLEPYSEGSPCGEDPGIFALTQSFSPDQNPDWEPNWTEANKACKALLESQVKTVQLGVIFSLLSLNSDGLPGFANGLRLLKSWCDKYWDDLHPILDTDEPSVAEQAWERVRDLQFLSNNNSSSAIAIVANGSADPYAICDRLRTTPLCKTERFPGYSLNEFLTARGDLEPPTTTNEDGEEVAADFVSQAQIEAGMQNFVDSFREEFDQHFGAIADCQEELRQIRNLFGFKTGENDIVSFRELEQALGSITEVLQPFAGAGSTTEEEDAEGPDGGDQSDGGRQGGGPQEFKRTIDNSEEAKEMLRRVSEYFERKEPSSPVPILLRRAMKLINMNFMQIIENMAEGAKEDVNRFIGPEDNEES